MPSHKGLEEVSQVEAEDGKSEPGLDRGDVQRPGVERQGQRWAQACWLLVRGGCAEIQERQGK